jgi:uncharacterized lipoprotein YajG
MKKLAMSVVTMLVAGCATTADLRAHAPIFEVASSKASRVVAACITEKWQASGVFGMAMRVDNNVLADGYSVSVSNQQTVQLMADVHDSGAGSTIRFYKPGFVLATGKFEDAIKACQ